jgi:hypothetical protein
LGGGPPPRRPGGGGGGGGGGGLALLCVRRPVNGTAVQWPVGTLVCTV